VPADELHGFIALVLNADGIAENKIHHFILKMSAFKIRGDRDPDPFCNLLNHCE
jgi:hypothetical protein